MNKFLIYVRQALAMMKEDKSFSAIYVAGTAVAIASAMVVAIVINISLGNIYPETKRDRTVYVSSFAYDEEGEFYGYPGFSPKGVEEIFGQLKCAEVVSASLSLDYIFRFNACAELGKQEVPVTAKFTDPNFFRLYDFRFVEGGRLYGGESEECRQLRCHHRCVGKEIGGGEGESETAPQLPPLQGGWHRGGSESAHDALLSRCLSALYGGGCTGTPPEQRT